MSANEKSADKRASEVMEMFGYPILLTDDRWQRLRGMFLAHARDQRHICAEAVNEIEPADRDVDPSRRSCDFLNAAHAAALNARAPGEGAKP